MENEYLKAFNKEFGFNLELKVGDDEIPGNPAISVGEMTGPAKHKYFTEQFVIFPFEKEEADGLDDTKHKVVKYQLIGFQYNSGGYWEPPSCDDYVVGDFQSFQSALNKVMEMYVSQKLDNLLEWVSESEMAKNEKDLEDWNEHD